MGATTSSGLGSEIGAVPLAVVVSVVPCIGAALVVGVGREKKE